MRFNNNDGALSLYNINHELIAVYYKVSWVDFKGDTLSKQGRIQEFSAVAARYPGSVSPRVAIPKDTVRVELGIWLELGIAAFGDSKPQPFHRMPGLQSGISPPPIPPLPFSVAKRPPQIQAGSVESYSSCVPGGTSAENALMNLEPRIRVSGLKIDHSLLNRLCSLCRMCH